MLNDNENKEKELLAEPLENNYEAEQTIGEDPPPMVKEFSPDEINKQAKDFASSANKIIEKHGGIVAVLLIASVVLLIEAIVTCSKYSSCGGKNGYAIAGGVIPFIVCVVYLILLRNGKVPTKGRLALAVFNFIMWTINVGVLTFHTQGDLSPSQYPYNVPSNAYIALWGGFAASTVLVSEEVAQFNQVLASTRSFSNYHLLVIVGGFIVLFSALSPCAKSCGFAEGYAIAVGIVGILLGLVSVKLVPRMSDNFRSWFTFVQLIWWLVGTVICTFFDPFKTVGNGFFGCWAGVVGSLLLYLGERKSYDDVVENDDIPAGGAEI